MKPLIPHQAHNLARTVLDSIDDGTLLIRALNSRLSLRPCIPIIASLTSFPARIHRVWWAIQSLLQQTLQPERIILTLSLQEFPDRVIPRDLRRITKRGLEIKWVEHNGRSYDKLLPVARQFPDHLIMTFDDDKIYPSNLLEEIWKTHQSHPRSIIGSRGWEVMTGEGLLEYGKGWIRASKTTPPTKTFLIGGGGILYPPSARSAEMLDGTLASILAPTADDIWFWGCSLRNDVDIRCLGLPGFRPVRGLEKTPALKHINAHKNSEQFQAVLSHFRLEEKLS